MPASGDSGGFITVWDMEECRKIWSVRGHGDQWVWALAFTPDGRHLVSAGGDNRVVLRDAATGRLVREYAGFNNVVTSLALTADGKHVLAGGVEGSLDGIIRIWDLESGMLLRDFRGHKWIAFVGPAHVLSLDVTRDSRHVVSSDGQGNIILWDFASGREIRRYPLQGSSMTIKGIFKVAFLPDGKRFMSTRIERIALCVARMRDTETGETLRTFEGDIIKLSLSPDGRLMLTGGPDGIVRIWDLEGGNVTKELAGQSIFFRTAFSADTMAFSPDMKRIVTGSPDGSVRLWDAASGKEMALMAAFDDGEWLMITTDGYYASSPAGHNYLNVMYGSTLYAASQFYDVFYRPDIVSAIFRGRDVGGLAVLTMKEVVTSPPPETEFTGITPGTGQAVGRAKVCFRVKNRGGGIGEVRLFHNGKLVLSDGFYRDIAPSDLREREPASMTGIAMYEEMRSLVVQGKGDAARTRSSPRGETHEQCVDLDTVPGDNEVSLTAFNRENTVQGMLKSSLFRSMAGEGDRHLYILSLGINRYASGKGGLKYAVKDARDIHDMLIRQSLPLYNPGNIHSWLLTDDLAAKVNIIRTLDEISRAIRPVDGFIFYAAGHGVLVQGRFSLLTHDFDGTVHGGSMMDSHEIVDMSKKIKSLSQLYIFDTCHAGGVDHIVGGLYDARISVLARKMGLHIFASAGSLQAALDGYRGNGLFTHTVLEGLDNRAEADLNRDGAVSLVELGIYTRSATAAISEKMGVRQNPVIINFGRDFPVYLVGRRGN